jgi:alkylation response protein AidB-like acyl-CoA dehydrogenase
VDNRPADVARRLATRFAARAADHDTSGAFPADDFADLRSAGMFGLMVPTRLGGAGAGVADYVDVAYELPWR